MTTTQMQSAIARYISVTETLQAGGLLDAEVDRLLDRQEAIVKSLQRAGYTVRELVARPWIAVTDTTLEMP